MCGSGVGDGSSRQQELITHPTVRRTNAHTSRVCPRPRRPPQARRHEARVPRGCGHQVAQAGVRRTRPPRVAAIRYQRRQRWCVVAVRGTPRLWLPQQRDALTPSHTYVRAAACGPSQVGGPAAAAPIGGGRAPTSLTSARRPRRRRCGVPRGPSAGTCSAAAAASVASATRPCRRRRRACPRASACLWCCARSLRRVGSTHVPPSEPVLPCPSLAGSLWPRPSSPGRVPATVSRRT